MSGKLGLYILYTSLEWFSPYPTINPFMVLPKGKGKKGKGRKGRGAVGVDALIEPL